ncbi:DUF6301 family protein [Catellatospora citrea]|uniref:TY-Chap N-terminal domain-containing protein n=1 Tax=Catellatospora citrea TaxID=53366 RepID=A0A8J3KK14_9ACTN|nr:DUF6301 family protein [Catellatospora citrea]RKE06662.1 hypothetical protein C8E86_1484 [Catellatospora citrea]GIF98658.1 hypothetical protein Cci01nite_37520 [Catellatospora citrea]
MSIVRVVADPPPATVFAVLRDWRWAWSAAEVPALAEHLGWRIVHQVDGGTALAAPAADPAVRHTIAGARGEVHYLDVKLTDRVAERTEQTDRQLDEAFTRLVAEAVDVLGPVGGATPETSRQWRLPNGTVRIGRTSWSVVATWRPPDPRWAAAAAAGRYPLGGWVDFTARLRDDLLRLDGGVVLLRHGARVVQFASSHGVLCAEVVADHAAVPEPDRFSARQHEALLGLGWREPRPSGDPNWTCEPVRHLTGPGVEALADRLVATLRDVLGVDRPGHLLVESWDDDTAEPLDLAVCR